MNRIGERFAFGGAPEGRRMIPAGMRSNSARRASGGSHGTVPLRGDLDVLHLTRRIRNRQAVLAKTLDVKDDCQAYLGFDFSNCSARGNATGKVWHVCRVVAFRLFNDNGVAHKPLP